MKHIGFVLLAAAALTTACTSDPAPVEFGVNRTEPITMGPEGGTEKVKVSAKESWVASTEESWIQISPANGDASQECKIRIDSTFQDVLRTGEVRFTSAGVPRVVKVSQMGFSKQIVVEGSEVVEGSKDKVYSVALPDYAPFGTTFFDVNITTNVDFNVKIVDNTTLPDDAPSGTTSSTDWLKCESYEVNLTQSKPRTLRLRFNWNYNTKWWNQKVNIRFEPKNGEALAIQQSIAVEQSKAPKITDDRAGDSIAVLAIKRQLNLYNTFDPSKNMLDWGEDIKLYDKSAPKELRGRVKFVRFFMFDTNVGIPFEVRYLTKTEEIIFYSNANNFTRDIDLGTSICELGNPGCHLKRLSIDAFGFGKLPEGFVKLGRTLEQLSLGSENFDRVPDIITPANFPHLKKFAMGANRRVDIYDLSNSSIDKPGLGGELPRYLLEWEQLEELNFSYNYFEGKIPDMKDYPILWTEADGYPSLVGKPKVLPNCKVLRLNLNRFTGSLPDWILNHPNIVKFDPYQLIFNQDGKDTKGNRAGFDNVPDKVSAPVKQE